MIVELLYGHNQIQSTQLIYVNPIYPESHHRTLIDIWRSGVPRYIYMQTLLAWNVPYIENYFFGRVMTNNKWYQHFSNFSATITNYLKYTRCLFSNSWKTCFCVLRHFFIQNNKGVLKFIYWVFNIFLL